MKQISLTTDGACIGNPGSGGWACVLRYKDCVRELSGAERNTTNNKMELRAVIEGLRAYRRSESELGRELLQWAFEQLEAAGSLPNLLKYRVAKRTKP